MEMIKVERHGPIAINEFFSIVEQAEQVCLAFHFIEGVENV